MNTITVAERNARVQANLGLVKMVAHKFEHYANSKYNVTYEDLESVGYEGLIRAAERFDNSTGNAFSTYAVPWICGAILHYLRDRCTAAGVKLPRQLIEEGFKLRTVSFDAPLRKDEESSTFADIIADEPATLPLLERADLEQAIARLDPKYGDAIRLVYLEGLHRNEAAERLSTSHMTITRRIRQGLEDLRLILGCKTALVQPPTPSQSTFSIHVADSATLETAINKLSNPERELAILHYQNRLTAEDLAAWLEQPIGVIKTRLDSVTAKLNQILSGKVSRSRFKTHSAENPYPIVRPHRDKSELHLPPNRSICVYCQGVFGSPNPRQYCSVSCVQSDKKGWSPAEIQLLKSFVGKVPAQEIPRLYQQAAQVQGLKERTETAIKVKLKRVAATTKATANNWTMYELSRQLGVPVDKIRCWRRNGLPHRKLGDYKIARVAITREDLLEYARQNPERFAGIDPGKLQKVLKDERVVAQIMATPIPIKARQVQRKDTGQKYPSLRAAGRALGRHHIEIRREIERENGWIQQTKVVLNNNEVIVEPNARFTGIQHSTRNYNQRLRDRMADLETAIEFLKEKCNRLTLENEKLNRASHKPKASKLCVISNDDEPKRRLDG